jgi:hypothetical protein
MQSRMPRGWMGAVVGLFLVPITARAHVNLVATLDPAQETPPVTDADGAGGMATFEYDASTKMLSYTVAVHDLTGPAIFAHIHQAPPGVAGNPIFTLDPAATSGTVGPLDAAQETALFDGVLYINFHTALHAAGEIRGQITLAPGTCSCGAFRNHGQFVKCVRKAIKALDKSEKKEAGIKQLRKNSAKSSCGKKKGPRKAVACCLPRTPDDNIVTESLCIAVKDAACAGKGGTSKGAGSSCFPTNPCSPSGAFLDADTIF